VTDEVHERLAAAVKAGLWVEFTASQARLLEHVRALERDAKRYRFLRAQHWSYGHSALVVVQATTLEVGDNTYSWERLDEVIDAELPPG
jgi:hypothetical protein